MPFLLHGFLSKYPNPAGFPGGAILVRQRVMAPSFYIGCSGYYYSYWRNRFYPKGVKPANWLSYYSTVFNTVELNGSFYRVPEPASLQQYAAATGDEFRFSVKMNRLFTHLKRLKDCRPGIDSFQQLVRDGLGNKLHCFLFQLPPSFYYNEENMERVLNSIPHHQENVIELRHISWWNETVRKTFMESGYTFCNVDFPGLDTYFMHTSDVFYLRLHGSPELFKSPYSTEQLSGFHVQFPANAKENYIYFNNTYYEAGYTNAQQLMNLVK